MAELETAFWGKVEENLAGAESEFINNRYNNSANRCYYAVYHAAIYALSHADIFPAGDTTQWPHEFVRAQFIDQLINRRKIYPTNLRNTLEDNRALRQTADYRRDHVTEVRAARAIRRAEQFLEVIGQQTEATL